MHITRYSTEIARSHFNGKTKNIVEVGVGNATNGLDMREKLNSDVLYLVDPYVPPDGWPNYDYTAKEALANLRIVERKIKDLDDVILVHKKSHEAVVDVPDELDLVYIDAIHDYEHVQQDIECWYPKIRIGGILCGHDYYEEGVRLSVLNKFSVFDESILSVDRVGWGAESSDWFIIKT